MTTVSDIACLVPSCGRDAFCRGWCRPHYMRWWKHGDVRANRPIGGYTTTEVWCPGCTRMLARSEFHQARDTKRGAATYCKACTALNHRTIYRETMRASGRRWVEANRDRVAENGRRWAAANPDKMREKKRRLVAKHPEKARLWAQTGDRNRRARERDAPGWTTTAKTAARWAYFGGRCWMCGDVATVMDHVKPLAAGGAAWPANLRPACTLCNQRKRARWPFDVEEFRARRAS